ncbi:SusC/RagA family TonB-linked outer membrane protein [Saccharicrinis sp. FJH2]|uniref:SusC/RagA family TonB-linked outer membrane protein n=1 Tax=Saccharicrinis sp. FJH65 TaxID=3344659 RepID=UPI0035F4860F
MRQKIKKQAIILLSTLLLFSTNIFAQTVTVTGTVTDAKDESPLPGVSILVKGTTMGVITDFDGNYSITIPSANETLVFSFIGYNTKEVTTKGQTVINVALDPKLEQLEEFLVIGYGVQKKEDKTGAVYNVTDKDIQTVAVQDPIEGIQGKVAGVTIRKAGSDPNAGFNVKIRGASGLSAGTDPLYVVDGVVGVDPTTIAPEDIASFNILKDASSAAIYGSRGANGVIIITTKKGQKGESRIEFSSYGTIDQIASKSRLDLMSANEYRAYANELGIEIRDLGYNTDWQDEIYRTGYSNNESLAFSGGNENGNYRASVSHNNMQGIVLNSGKQRTIMRLNAETKAFNDVVTLSMNIANTIEHNDYINYGSSGADGVLFQAFQRNPTIPVYNEDGTYYQDPTQPVNNYSNPVAVLNDIQNTRDAKRFLGRLKTDIDVFNGFKITLNGAYTRDDSESSYFEPASNGPINGEGYGRRNYGNNASILFEAFANYKKEFNNHSLNLVGGYSYQKFLWDGFSAEGKNPGSDYTRADDLASLALVVPGDVDSYKGESKLISGFGRLVYNYAGRYFVTATLRRDGSSKFGANKEWGLFPSASLAWNMKQESFMKDVDFLSLAKIRLGYGQTGNQEIDSYRNIALYGVTGYTQDPTTNKYTVNYGAIQNPNLYLKWEVNTEINIGADFGLLNDRITGSVDYYNKKTTDLIYSYTVPVPPNLVTSTLANGGAIDINGFEASLTGHILAGLNAKWASTIVATHDKAIITALGNEQYPAVEKVNEGYLQEPLGYGTYTQIMKKGEERGTFFGPKFVGIDKRTGSFLYEKADGTYATIDNIEEKDKQILGHAQPKLELGWSNNITLFKDWDLTFTLRGMFGHDILNATNMVFDNPSYFPTRNVLNSAPARTELKEASTFSDYFLEKGDFVRLENITVGYTFNTKNINWLQRARVFASGNNLWTLTQYSGIDPSTIGIDIFNVYPKSTTFTVGFNVTF